MFHGWMFDPDGDQAAADSTRSSTSLDTGSSVNPRTARRLLTASYTPMIAHPQLIGRHALRDRPLSRLKKRRNYSAGSTASTPFFFTNTTKNFAGFVVLAFRP